MRDGEELILAVADEGGGISSNSGGGGGGGRSPSHRNKSSDGVGDLECKGGW